MNKEKDTFGCLFLILGRKKSCARGCNLMRRKGQWLISFSKYVKLKKTDNQWLCKNQPS